jgi:hypothetical protein
MTLPTRKQFLERFPEFGEHPTKIIDSCITSAGLSTPERVWSAYSGDSPATDFHLAGCCYLAAHLLSIRITQIGNQIGAIAGQPVASTSQSMIPNTSSTMYGQEYERMRSTLPVSGFALN